MSKNADKFSFTALQLGEHFPESKNPQHKNVINKNTLIGPYIQVLRHLRVPSKHQSSPISHVQLMQCFRSLVSPFSGLSHNSLTYPSSLDYWSTQPATKQTVI